MWLLSCAAVVMWLLLCDCLLYDRLYVAVCRVAGAMLLFVMVVVVMWFVAMWLLPCGCRHVAAAVWNSVCRVCKIDRVVQ